MYRYPRGLSSLQKVSLSLMGVLVLVTFLGANFQALFWQSSQWLVSTVLPAVVVQLTNNERTDLNEVPLVRSAVLDKAAQLKADDMAKQQYFAHFSPTGVSPWHWFDEVGYVYAYAGENLAIHFTDSTEVVKAWMNSPAHRDNIVKEQYTEIGVGTAKGRYEGYDTVYVVQLFGTPAVPPPPTPAVASQPVSEPEPEPLATFEPTTTKEQSSTIPLVAAEADQRENLPTTTPVTKFDSASTTEPDALLASDEIVPAATTTPVVALVTPESDPVVPTKNTQPPPSEPTDTTDSVSVGSRGNSPADVVVLESSLIATSSGLAIAQVTTPTSAHAGFTVPMIATQPSLFLQISYLILGGIVFLLLGISIVIEARRFHMVQVTYGILLLCGMGTLWFLQSLLISGAVVA